MNRHNKFYAELEDIMDDDDYYDDDEYYDEEDGYYYEGGYAEGSGAAATATAAAVNNYLTITPDGDVDFELLDQLLPVLHEEWKTRAPMQLPLAEAEAVQALRDNEYDPETCVPVLAAKRKEEKQKSGGGAKVLKVTTSKKGDTKSTGEASTARTAASKDNDDEVEGQLRADGTVKPGGRRAFKAFNARYQDVKPDMSKPDCTFVVAGHVDAGKSTSLGHLLLLLGRVDSTEVERNGRQGKGTNKESFRYAWLLDQSEEERRRGVTIDSGSYCFETPHRRVNILDAPGHKDFVTNMISSTLQADAALLVVTAAPSEFETGLLYGTKDHLLILKTLGVGCIIVVINKMDSAGYSKQRYDFVMQEIKLLLKQLDLKANIVSGYVPISGMEGTNMLALNLSKTPWYKGPSLVEVIDTCPLVSRLVDGPLRITMQDVHESTLYVRIESGRVSRGQTLRFVPSGTLVDVRTIVKPTSGGMVDVAFAGEVVEIHTVSPLITLCQGDVGMATTDAFSLCSQFEARVQTLPTLQNAIIPGAKFTMCIHSLVIDAKVVKLVAKVDGRGNWSKGMVKCIPADTQAVISFEAPKNILVEKAEDCPALGRFVLQQDGTTVAGGLVNKMHLPLN